MGMPWRVALAMQADGWYLRQDIIWAKPNPMPESVTDRCTKAHEYLFMLTKSPKYYFDATAVSEPMAPASINRLAQNVEAQRGSDRVPGKTNGAMKAVSRPENAERISASRDKYREAGLPDGPGLTRNRRSVWTVPTVPFKEAHFATYPERLIEPCILASTRPGDLVLDPFLGAGTTAVVADRLGRRWTGCELNSEYAAIAEARIRAVQPGLPLDNAA
jgi:DNA modification methylase